MSKKKILIYSPGSLGDTLVMLPTIRFIKDKYKPVEFVFLYDVQSGRKRFTPRDIFEFTKMFDNFVPYKYYSKKISFAYLFSTFKIYLFILLSRFDLIFYLPEVWRDETKFARDKFFFKLCLHGDKVIGFDRVINRPLECEGVMHKALELYYRSGGTIPKEFTPEDYSMAQYVNPINEKFQDNTYVLSPFSNMPSKDWPISSYSELCKKIYSKLGLIPVIYGGVEDFNNADLLIKDLGFGINKCSNEFQEITFEKLLNFFYKSKLYIGNDSGHMHIASALDLPIVAIFSSRDYSYRWHPISKKHIVHRVDVPCKCCFLKECNEFDNLCLKKISVNSVFRSVEIMISS